jgi:uncharacterized protein
MYIETKEIGPEGLTVDRVIDVLPVPVEGGEVVRVDRVHLTGEFLKASGGISFTGDVGTVATLACSRCLEHYSLPLELHFNLLFTTSPEAVGGGESRVSQDRITESHYDGARIDLGELVAEQLYLGLPLKPLCRPDCLGLCPRCGVNRNLGSCDCREERDADPRLLALKKLL